MGAHGQVANLCTALATVSYRNKICKAAHTVKADLAARATLRQCKIISSSVTSFVSSIPSATMAKLSPTKIISIPARSATSAEGKSCAVSIVMGSPFL